MSSEYWIKAFSTLFASLRGRISKTEPCCNIAVPFLDAGSPLAHDLTLGPENCAEKKYHFGFA